MEKKFAKFGAADGQVDDEELREIDENLAEVLTDTGIVRGASSIRTTIEDRDGNQIDSHYDLKDGTVHTIHIFANENADSDSANVFVPAGCTDITITSEDTVVARNPKTGVVILIAHVQVGNANKTNLQRLKKRMKTTKENGSMLIGKVGGKGGATEFKDKLQYVHSHLSIFPSEDARVAAFNFKKQLQAESKLADYNSEIKQHLSDFRDLV